MMMKKKIMMIMMMKKKSKTHKKIYKIQNLTKKLKKLTKT